MTLCRARSFVAFLVVIACIIPLSPAVAQAPSGLVPPEFFGIHTTKTTTWPTVPFGAFRLWDTQTNWTQLCSSSSSCDFTDLDSWINKANSQGITDIVYTFGKTPQWASSNPNDTNCNLQPGSCWPPADVNADGSGTDQIWKDFVTAIATHAGTRIQYWEIWNEPHNSFSWSGTYAQMVRMAKDARSIILSVNPNAKILSPSGTPAWMSQFLAAGGGDAFDIANLHTYLGGKDPEYVLTLINNERNALKTYGQQAKPLWIDEGGWGKNSLLTDPGAQAGTVARMYLVDWSVGVQRFYWYSYANSGFGTLWNSTSGLTPAGKAYGQVYDWMVGAAMSTPCSPNGTVWTCGFTRNSGAYQAQVVWNTAGNSSYQAPSQFSRFRDLAGSTWQIPADGTVTIGIKPIILETGSPTAQNLPPTASLQVSPNSGYAALTVTADASASTDPAGKTLTSSISFGDGSAAVSGMQAFHTYNSPGTYTVTATIANSSGLSSKATATVNVSARPIPVAVLSVTPQGGTAPVTVAADSSGSYETNGSIASRTINFGDGSAVATSTSASHTYTVAGTYTVTLTVTDALGTTAIASSTVTVVPPPVPVAVLSLSTQSGTAPITVTADSSGSYETNGSIASRTINFGDGSAVATSTSASHTYTVAGTYTVALTVTDARGATATTTRTVTVASAPGAITISSPADGGKMRSPAHVVASIADRSQVISVTVSINGVVKYQGAGNTVDVYLGLSTGRRNMTIKAQNQAGSSYSKTISFTVK